MTALVFRLDLFLLYQTVSEIPPHKKKNGTVPAMFHAGLFRSVFPDQNLFLFSGFPGFSRCLAFHQFLYALYGNKHAKNQKKHGKNKLQCISETESC